MTNVNSSIAAKFGPFTNAAFPTAALGTAAEITLGKMIENQQSDASQREVPYIKAANVRDGFVDTSRLGTMWASVTDIDRLNVDRDDIFVIEGGATAGRAAPLLADPPDLTIFQNSVHRIRARKGNDQRFLRYVLSCFPESGWYEALCSTSTFKHLTSEKIKTLRIPVPAGHEQRAIANFLDRETARIDTLIEKRWSQMRLLKEKWRGAIRVAMTELNQRHGTIPLKRLVKCLDQQRVPLSAEERHHRRGLFPYYGASGVIDHVDDWIFDEELVLLGEDGAQLGDPNYDISFVVRGKCWVNNHAHVLRPLDAEARFLAFHLSTFDRFAFMSGATREKITQDDMNRIPVPHLSAEEQSRVSGRLFTHQQQVTSLRDHLDSQVKLLNERRQALITAGVTGQMDIPSVA